MTTKLRPPPWSELQETLQAALLEYQRGKITATELIGILSKYLDADAGAALREHRLSGYELDRKWIEEFIRPYELGMRLSRLPPKKPVMRSGDASRAEPGIYSQVEVLRLALEKAIPISVLTAIGTRHRLQYRAHELDSSRRDQRWRDADAEIAEHIRIDRPYNKGAFSIGLPKLLECVPGLLSIACLIREDENTTTLAWHGRSLSYVGIPWKGFHSDIPPSIDLVQYSNDLLLKDEDRVFPAT